MSLSTYDDLVAAVSRHANRSDAAFLAVIPDLIALAEAEMRREVRARGEVQTLDLTITEDSYPLPCGFDGIVSMNGRGDVIREITQVSSDILDKTTYPDGWLFGNAYTISGNSIYFGRAPGDIRLRYRAMFSPLGPRCRCNWILSKAPDAYLYGALKHSAPYLEDDERLPMWGRLFADAIDGINRQAIAQTTGGPLTMRASVVI